MTRRSPLVAVILCTLAVWFLSSRPCSSADFTDAAAWYDTLGYSNAKDLPYVRVATGSWMQTGNQPPVNRFAEGFLVSEEPGAFIVFICSISDLGVLSGLSEPFPPLATVRFVRKTAVPAHQRIDYWVLDFGQAASEALERVRAKASAPRDGLDSISDRVRIFAFARACLQKGLSETGSALMNFAADIPDDQTGRVDARGLLRHLQQQIGDAVLSKAEADCANPSISWAELLTAYENFETRFPASTKVAYAREAADALRKMIAEDAAHRPKPLREMSPAGQIAEDIYQLRNLRAGFWIANERYPITSFALGGPEAVTPVHRLVDLGYRAVPQLIDALADRRFTRTLEQRWNTAAEPKAMRVGDVVRSILEHISERDFFIRRTADGKLINGMTRQAEEWWAEVQRKGEKQLLIEAAASGGEGGCRAARKLVEKYPDAAIETIEAEIFATVDDGVPGTGGETVHRNAGNPKPPPGEAGQAIESLLVSALDDAGRRVGMTGDPDEVSFDGPRVCDMAALVLSKRWPEKYQFQWAANPAECDAQIAKIRARWRGAVQENSPGR